MKSIETFQDDRALLRDGWVTPGGETEQNVKRYLGQTRDKLLDLRELNLTALVGESPDNESQDTRVVSKALGTLDLFNFDHTAKPPTLITADLDKATKEF